MDKETLDFLIMTAGNNAASFIYGAAFGSTTGIFGNNFRIAHKYTNPIPTTKFRINSSGIITILYDLYEMMQKHEPTYNPVLNDLGTFLGIITGYLITDKIYKNGINKKE